MRPTLLLSFTIPTFLSLLLPTPILADGSSTMTGQPATRTRDVKVGSNGQNFDPDTISADPGDLIHFHFYPQNHSIAQSDYDHPCVPLSGDSNGEKKPIFSGFFQSNDGEAKDGFSMRLNGSDPVWIYCSAYEHCKDGQVMVINPKSDGDQTLSKYKEAAKKATPSSPVDIFGGVVHELKKTGSAATSEPSATKTGAAGKLLCSTLVAGAVAAVGGLLAL